jgi:hypothetical protein
MIMNNAATLIGQIQLILATFVGELAQQVAVYGTLLGRRLDAEIYVSDWEYGSPNRQEDGSFKINVWHERSGYAIRLHITFHGTTHMLVKATSAGHDGDWLIFCQTVSSDTSASYLALMVGAAFEKKVTGRVEYSRNEWS